MNLEELIDQLQELADGGAEEVRFAAQPSWPVVYGIGDVVADDATGIVYISEGDRGRDESPYLHGAVREQLGW